MELTFKVNDEVLVFGKYEGTITEIRGDKVLLYCPAFNSDEPWLVTEMTSLVLLEYSTRLLN
jgi:hypothetical protein